MLTLSDCVLTRFLKLITSIPTRNDTTSGILGLGGDYESMMKNKVTEFEETGKQKYFCKKSTYATYT